MPNFKLFSLTTAVISLILSSQIQAKEPKNTTLQKITVTTGAENSGEVDGYKVGASSSSTRTNTPLLNTPQSISVVAGDQIRDQNITSMEEAARYVPGVNVSQGEGNRDQVMIRGNASTADFFIDGARDDMQYFRDFYNIDRVEFLKGPNAMAFGRGGSGGVINRIAKYADGSRQRRLTLSGGSFNNRRAQLDLGDRVNENFSLRLNTMYEKTGTFRQHGDLERYGFNPTGTLEIGANTEFKFGYEHFSDKRVNDRGLPSQGGHAVKVSPKKFFGNPNENTSDSTVDSIFATVTHDFNDNLTLKNYTRYTHNSKFYQNVYTSGAVNDATGNVTLSAYNKYQERSSITNQTDLTKKFTVGKVKHTALFGSEITVQNNKVERKTGWFDNASKNTTVSVGSPTNYLPITYRGGGTKNESDTTIYAIYAQDQIDVNKYLQLTAGLRYDSFETDLTDNNTGDNFKIREDLISPRAGIVIKPRESVSLYTSYSVSHLPSSGDQFDSLGTATALLEPEKLTNYEIGSKWDVNPRLNVAAAIYQLDRENTSANDPNNAGFYIATGESRTRGFEFSANGKVTKNWQLIASYAYQDAEITSETSGASKGAKVALVPSNTASLWNKYDFTPKFAAGLGIISHSSQFAGSDNTVKIKGFTRFDAAVYYKIDPSHRVQLNVENLFDRGYIRTGHNNNNLQPGSTRAFKVSLISDF
jgi:catecholate siderophore receptor